ncbi:MULTISPECIES: esterase/lipase family protein [unclassified Rathayibacter]|uniref:esterase/lipase family protein n=1 Tax=unclassified Rathayibacter TaxID=2609250 RepID=UPI0006F3A957|nr:MULTISPECIES: hypothetical protein [unclassified Rathayibacter]KQQ05255.1 hypothetical protein ASF42_01160 [Rathayibacter sp. Leaf294]KQS13117.1 hypothetical protein ASG06_01160 [Rathayibacter sp. Leaf185]
MRFVVVVLAALLAVVGAVVVPATPAEALTASPPASCGVAQLAPVLEGDEVDPAPAASVVPIILLHGWLGTATHDDSRTGAFSHLVDLIAPNGVDEPVTTSQRSMIGMLQEIEGTAVYTFDYRDLAARWVTDPGIADALASALDCVTRATGNRAIVVAHSMGGLAARQALSQSVDGVPVESMVSDVITFGTPNTGSDLAARLGEIIDSTGAVSPAVVAGLEPQSRLGISALLASCGEDASEDASKAGECTGMPMIDALSSQAGIAMRTGSIELGDLPPWPAGIHVVALAGDIKVTVAAVLGTRVGVVDLGDIIVGNQSAEAGVDEYYVSTCRYTLLSMPDVPAVMAELNPLARLGDALRFSAMVVAIDASPCHHAKLMRNVELTERAGAEAASAVAATLAQPRPGAAEVPTLRHAPVADDARRRMLR